MYCPSIKYIYINYLLAGFEKRLPFSSDPTPDELLQTSQPHPGARGDTVGDSHGNLDHHGDSMLLRDPGISIPVPELGSRRYVYLTCVRNPQSLMLFRTSWWTCSVRFLLI